MRCEYCPIEQGTVIVRSIEFDYGSFGNRTFDCVRLAKFYIEFDYVRLSSAIERLVFDWVRLDTPGLMHRKSLSILTFPQSILHAK